MDMIDCVRGSPDDTSAHSEMSIDCRPEVRDNHTLVVTSNDPQGTTINRRKNDKCRLDIRDDDMCGIMNKLAFANFHDVSVKCDRVSCQ